MNFGGGGGGRWQGGAQGEGEGEQAVVEKCVFVTLFLLRRRRQYERHPCPGHEPPGGGDTAGPAAADAADATADDSFGAGLPPGEHGKCRGRGADPAAGELEAASHGQQKGTLLL